MRARSGQGGSKASNLGPDSFDTLGRDLVEATTGARLEDDPLHLDTVAVLLVGRPGADLDRPPSVDVLREESERLLDRDLHMDALADRLEPRVLGRHGSSLRPGGRTAAPLECSDDLLPACALQFPAQLRMHGADHRFLLSVEPEGTDSANSLNAARRWSHIAPIARIHASASANALVRSS